MEPNTAFTLKLTYNRVSSCVQVSDDSEKALSNNFGFDTV